MYKRSVAHFGNPYRIINLIKKARAGENITYVCIGGSITQGAMASHRFGKTVIHLFLRAGFKKASHKLK